MFGATMVEPQHCSSAASSSSSSQSSQLLNGAAAVNHRHHHHHQQQQHYRHQVIKTTRVHHSTRTTRHVVTVQEKVVRSRLQLGYSTPTNFINRYILFFIQFLFIFFFLIGLKFYCEESIILSGKIKVCKHSCSFNSI